MLVELHFKIGEPDKEFRFTRLGNLYPLNIGPQNSSTRCASTADFVEASYEQEVNVESICGVSVQGVWTISDGRPWRLRGPKISIHTVDLFLCNISQVTGTTMEAGVHDIALTCM